jgi:hypothetical protein
LRSAGDRGWNESLERTTRPSFSIEVERRANTIDAPGEAFCRDRLDALEALRHVAAARRQRSGGTDLHRDGEKRLRRPSWISPAIHARSASVADLLVASRKRRAQ